MMPVGIMLIVGGVAWCEHFDTFGNDPAKIVHAKIAGTPEQLEKTLSGDAHDTSLWASVHHDQYKLVSYSWDSGHTDHPESFAATVREGRAPDLAGRARLEAKLRGGFDENDSWSWGHLSVHFDKKSGIASASVRAGDEDPRWRERLQAAHALVLGAIFDVPAQPAPADLELLGAPYPFADLAKIAPTTTVDAAKSVVAKQFPGALFDLSGQVKAIIPIGHPDFFQAELTWSNSRGATLSEIELVPIGGHGALASKELALATCLGKTYGAASAHDVDFMKGTKYYSLRVGSELSMDIREYGVSVRTYGRKLEAADWAKLVAALDGCR